MKRKRLSLIIFLAALIMLLPINFANASETRLFVNGTNNTVVNNTVVVNTAINNTVATNTVTTMPQTGETSTYIIFAFAAIFIVLGIVSFIKSRSEK